jgi:hypothetical protein
MFTYRFTHPKRGTIVATLSGSTYELTTRSGDKTDTKKSQHDTDAKAKKAFDAAIAQLVTSGWELADVDGPTRREEAPPPKRRKSAVEKLDELWADLEIETGDFSEIVVDVADDAPPRARLDAVLADPRLTRTQRIWIYHWYVRKQLDYRPWVKAVAAAKLPAVSSLSIGYGGDAYQSARVGVLPAALWDHLPALREIDVSGIIDRVDNFRAPCLELLMVSGIKMSRDCVAALLASDYPRLKRVDLNCAASFSAGEGLTSDVLSPFLRRNDVPDLRAVAWFNFVVSSGFIDALVRAPWFAQLEALTIHSADIAPSERAALLSHAGRLSHLRSMTVSADLLHDGLIARLPNVTITKAPRNLGELKATSLQSLVVHDESASVPEQDLASIPPSTDKHKQMAILQRRESASARQSRWISVSSTTRARGSARLNAPAVDRHQAPERDHPGYRDR